MPLIDYTDFDKVLPRRDDFTGPDCDPDPATSDMLFMPNAISERVERNRGAGVYTVYMTGIVPSGRRTVLILRNIEVYIDVETPNGVDAAAFQSRLRLKLADSGCNFRRMETKHGKPLKGFRVEPSQWARVYFNTLKDRTEALETCVEAKYNTASDDPASNYFALTARRYRFNTCGWNRIHRGNYALVKDSLSTCRLTYECDVKHLEPLNESEIVGGLERDRLMVLDWDIETRTFGAQTGEAPRAGDTNYEIFMISMLFSWHYTDECLTRVCLLTKKTRMPCHMDRDRDYVVVCPDERTMLILMGRLAGRMQPDNLTAFNCGNFDWPIVRDRAKHHDVLGVLRDGFSTLKASEYERKNVYKSCFRDEKVKISAEEPKYKTLTATFPGVIDTDCMVVFKQLYTTAEVCKGYSLNFYLKMNKLSGKEDMAIKRMFRICDLSDAATAKCMCGEGDPHVCPVRVQIADYYREGLTEKPEPWFDADHVRQYTGKSCREVVELEMSLVTWYCVVDAYRCRQLYVIRSITDDKRELSNMSYVSLYDSFYRANGMKVRNLIGRWCSELGIMFSNSKSDRDKIKYPGAWVFPPKKGLNNERPTTALDFSSLYPSLMMAYNLSPDKSIVRKDDRRNTPEHIRQADEFAQSLRDKGYDLHHVKFTCSNGTDVEGWTVRHRGNHLMSHQDQPKMTRWQYRDGKPVVENGKLVPVYDGMCLPGESMGVFPYILKRLFDKRATVKVPFNALGKLKEKCETEMNKYRVDGIVMYENFLTDADIRNTGFMCVADVTYKDVCFRRNKLDSKQRAMKVHMNTFYGESGNNNSPIYELMVAGGVTTAGQYNIKKVSSWLTTLGYDVRYGDSVTGDTPILTPYGYVDISQLSSGPWTEYTGDKQQAAAAAPVWTDRGWTRVLRVIRHYCHKQIYRVVTASGLVDVTADHSLLDVHSNVVKPSAVRVGMELLHADLPFAGTRSVRDPVDDTVYGYYNDKRSAASACMLLGDTAYRVWPEGDGYVVSRDTTHGNSRDRVVSISCLGYVDCYVYDLETENSHFAVGPGRLVVHNTDSNYLCCPVSMFTDLDAAFNRHLEHIRRIYELYPNEYTEDDVQRHRKAISAIYDAVDVSFAKRIRAGECKRDDYYVDESSWANALAYVENAITSGDAVSAAITALKSRSREDCWIKMVQITRCNVEELRVRVNRHLAEDNLTEFLLMAYEEVLFPAGYFGKKKYGGFAHLDRENFHPTNRELFIKGIDIVKQGQTELAKEWGYSLIQEIFSVDNYRNIEEIVHDKLRQICAKKFETKYFIKSGKYKKAQEGKPGNVTIRRFVERMAVKRQYYLTQGDPVTAALYPIPDYGDRLFWVVVKCDYTRNLRGQKRDPKIADKMEYVEAYEASLKTDRPMEIDMDYYLDSSIFGLFARFMAYKTEFEPPGAATIDWDDKEAYKKYDESVIKNAKKYIVAYCESLDTKPKHVDKTGAQFQKVYRKVDKSAKANLTEVLGSEAFAIVGISWYDDKNEAANRSGRFVTKANRTLGLVLDQLEQMTEVTPEYGRQYISGLESRGVELHTYRQIYVKQQTGRRDTTLLKCNEVIKRAQDRLFELIEPTLELLMGYDQRFSTVVNDVRIVNTDDYEPTNDQIATINRFTSDELELLVELNRLFIELLTNMRTRKQTRSICIAIDQRWTQAATEADASR